MKSRVLEAETLAALTTLPTGWADIVVADAPYSSGGLFRSDRARPTGAKYVRHDIKDKRPDYGGDNRDQRSYGYWVALWLSECLRIAKPGAYLFMFTDWRQLPVSTDAMQAGGFQWRGLIPWDKGEGARAPHTGYFRHQSEYILWGTHGVCNLAPGRGPFPGVIRCPVRQAEKFHQAGKPTEVYRRLFKAAAPGARVLDPFCGSGPAGVAAAELGLDYVGIERMGEFATMTRDRIAATRKARTGGARADATARPARPAAVGA